MRPPREKIMLTCAVTGNLTTPNQTPYLPVTPEEIADVKAAIGMMPYAVFPRTPGRDFAGVVVAGPAELIGAARNAEPYRGHASGDVAIVDSSSGDAAARVRELTGGKGADIVFNTVGEPYYEGGTKSLAILGRQIFIASFKTPVAFDIFAFYRGRHTYVGRALDDCHGTGPQRPAAGLRKRRAQAVSNLAAVDLPIAGGRNRLRRSDGFGVRERRHRSARLGKEAESLEHKT